jgi:hypothetical protein
METAGAVSHSGEELGGENLSGRVVGKLEVVDARHDARVHVVCLVRRLVSLSDDRQGWVEASESYKKKKQPVRSASVKAFIEVEEERRVGVRRETHLRSATWEHR